jgi:undecaprenyl diphosphate synthase
MEGSLKDRIIKDKMPQHVAVIMDGNGRWAQRKGNERIFGHQNAVKAVRNTAEAAAELGIKYLTLYAFSTENWNRPRTEIDALMTLFVSTIHKETKTLMNNNIRLQSIGDRDSLPKKVRQNLERAEDTTRLNSGMRLILALSYSARWEILHAIRMIAQEIEKGKLTSKDLDCDMLSDFLQTKDIPDPELLIRTSGEYRVSNFLLWQIAYSELYFTDTLWPDFTKEDFYRAICNYQHRERRFGKISEQVVSKELK